MKRRFVMMSGLVGIVSLAAVSRPAIADGESDGTPPGELRRQAVLLFREDRLDEGFALLQRARAAYEEKLLAAPADPETVRNLAMTLFELGEYETAQELFQRSLTLDAAAPTAETTAGREHGHPATHDITQPAAPAAAQPPFAAPRPIPFAVRGIEIHLDHLYDPDPEITAGNVRAFITEATGAKANIVYAHALTGVRADGAYGGAYFDTAVLPVRENLLTPLAEQLHANGLALHAILPTLSLALPETDANRSMLAMRMGPNGVEPSRSWRKRLSPFNTNGLAMMIRLYDDLAASVPLDGVVFGDDAYLTDAEDLNPAAVERYKETLGVETFPPEALRGDHRALLADIKAEQLNRWCAALMETVGAHRPNALFSRTLYAPAIRHPPSKLWLAQDFGQALLQYDMVLALADPEMEDLNWGNAWLLDLARCVVQIPSAAERTVFCLSSYSQKRGRWRPERTLAGTAHGLIAAGVIHLALGPDDILATPSRSRMVKRVFREAP